MGRDMGRGRGRLRVRGAGRHTGTRPALLARLGRKVI